jgi:hypothetical protein
MYFPFDCEGESYYYEAIQLKVIKSGCYNLSSDSNINTLVDIYKNNFNPIDRFQNLLYMDDNSFENAQFQLRISLQANIIYVLVVTTLNQDVMGEFSVVLSGPNNVSLNRISKNLYYLVNS